MTWTTAFGTATRTSYTSDDHNASEPTPRLYAVGYVEYNFWVPGWMTPVSNDTGSMVYIGAEDGVRAFNIPALSVAWTFATDRPVEDTVTWHGGYVYFTCLDHRIYKVNASTGALVWSYLGGEGFSVNPLVVTVGASTMVFAGGRDGIFYALTDGGSSPSLTWSEDCGYPIMAPATANATSSATAVFWTAMDGYVYRADAADGDNLVQSGKLVTAGFRQVPPVYDPTYNILYVSIERNYKQDTLNGPGLSTWPTSIESGYLEPSGVVDDAWYFGTTTGVSGPWPGDTSATVVDFLANPSEATFQRPLGMFDDSARSQWRNVIMLGGTNLAQLQYDFGDSTSRYPPIINHDGHTRCRPPVCVAPDGTAVFMMRSISYSIPKAMLYQWVPGSRYAYPVPGTAHNHDEALSICLTPTWAQTSYSWEFAGNTYKWDVTASADCDTDDWADFSPRPGAQKYILGDYDWGMGSAYMTYGGIKGVYAAIQPWANQVVIPGGYVVQNAWGSLLLWSEDSGDLDGSRVAIISGISSPTYTVPEKSAATLESILESEISQVLTVSSGNSLLRPAYIAHSNIDRFCESETYSIPYEMQYERSLARTYVALANAASHLSSPTALRNYIKWLWDNWGPCTIDTNLIPWSSGAAREWNTPPSDVSFSYGSISYESPNWGRNPFSVYGAMKVLQAFDGDSGFDAQDVHDDMFTTYGGTFTDTFAWPSTGYETQIDAKDVLIACYGAGMIGAKYICDEVGDTTRSALAQTRLESLVDKFYTAFSTAYPYAASATQWRPLRIWNMARWFYWMTPEFGAAVIAEYPALLSTIQSAISEYWQLAPLWYNAHPHVSYVEATMGAMYNRTMLQGEAIFNSASRGTLSTMLDVPAYVGDMTYIQNLVTTLDAAVDVSVSLDRSAGLATTAIHHDVDQTVDTGMYKSLGVGFNAATYSSDVFDITNASDLATKFNAESGGSAGYAFGVYATVQVGKKILVASGNIPADLDGAMVMSLAANGTLTTEYVLQEQGCHMMLEHQGMVLIPGTDNTNVGQGWDWGAIYIRDTSSNWTRKATVPNAMHVYAMDVGPDDALYIGTGSHTGDYATWEGVCYKSTDWGDTWTRLSAPCSYRLFQLRFHGYNRLWAIAQDETMPPPYDIRPGHLLYSEDYGLTWTDTGIDVRCRPQFTKWRDKLVCVGKYNTSLILISHNGDIDEVTLPFTVDSTDYQYNVMLVDSGTFYIATTTGIYRTQDANLDSWGFHVNATGLSSIGHASAHLGLSQGGVLMMTTKGTTAQIKGSEMATKRIYNYPVLSTPDETWMVLVDKAGEGTARSAAFPTAATALSDSPTTTPTGGNARGTHATDLQAVRAQATQVASGDYAIVAGSRNNTASGLESVTLGGQGNIAAGTAALAHGNGCEASGNYSIAMGDGNWIYSGASSGLAIGGNGNEIYSGVGASAIVGSAGSSAGTQSGSSVIVGGVSNYVNATYSVIVGGYLNSVQSSSALAYVMGQYGKAINMGQAVNANGFSVSTLGDGQASTYILKATTTDATQTVMLHSPASPTMRVTVSANQVASFEAHVTGITQYGAKRAYYIVRGVIRRDNSGTTSIAGVTTTTVYETDVGWDATATANDTDEALEIRVTGAGSTTIKWLCRLQTVEVTYA